MPIKIKSIKVYIAIFCSLLFIPSLTLGEIVVFTLHQGNPVNNGFMALGAYNHNITTAVADELGAVVEYTLDYQTGCSGTFNYTWEFSKPIQTLAPSDEFDITLTCEDCVAECGFRWSRIEGGTAPTIFRGFYLL